jgi:hypothetical protein
MQDEIKLTYILLHLDLLVITPLATKVHVVIKSFAVLTKKYDRQDFSWKCGIMIVKILVGNC